MAEENNNYGGISSEAVKEATGKGWDEWLNILDLIEANKMKHADIAAWIFSKRLANGWWSQMVTVGYEQARGMREKHQITTPGGKRSYGVNVTVTVNAPIKQLYKAVADIKLRKAWLREKIEVSSTTKEKYLRGLWDEGKTKVSFGFYFKGKDKSQVVIEHSKLESMQQVEEKKKFWKDRLGKLKGQLEKVQPEKSKPAAMKTTTPKFEKEKSFKEKPFKEKSAKGKSFKGKPFKEKSEKLRSAKRSFGKPKRA
jgi:hypothetical protein